MGSNGHLTTTQVSQLLGLTRQSVNAHARQGVIVSGWAGEFRRFTLSAVVDYWRTYHEGKCVRCTIRGEARPELGFMCEPCAYEVKTGRIWWPVVSRCTTYRLPHGRLNIGGDNGSSCPQ